MIYNEQQLVRLSRPPFKYEREQVIATHSEIRKAVDTFFDKQRTRERYNLSSLPELQPFLQGSYANDTNITQSSDVDIVIMLTTIWKSDTVSLSADEKEKYFQNTKSAEYSFLLYNADIISCLVQHFGQQYIFNDDKCIRLRNHPGFCDADIIPAFMYKLYRRFTSAENQSYKEGISFDTNAGIHIINYPKLHSEGLVQKSASTNGNFKETVRMFKNLRNELTINNRLAVDDAKSYYIENMLFNIDDNVFAGNCTQRLRTICASLIEDYNAGRMGNYQCANGVTSLFSDSAWKLDLARKLIVGLQEIIQKNAF